MNQRFRITRSMNANTSNQEISLEECQAYFSSKADFTYQTVLTVKGRRAPCLSKGFLYVETWRGPYSI